MPPPNRLKAYIFCPDHLSVYPLSFSLVISKGSAWNCRNIFSTTSWRAELEAYRWRLYQMLCTTCLMSSCHRHVVSIEMLASRRQCQILAFHSLSPSKYCDVWFFKKIWSQLWVILWCFIRVKIKVISSDY